jgi:hypothetical protein
MPNLWFKPRWISSTIRNLTSWAKPTLQSTRFDKRLLENRIGSQRRGRGDSCRKQGMAPAARPPSPGTATTAGEVTMGGDAADHYDGFMEAESNVFDSNATRYTRSFSMEAMTSQEGKCVLQLLHGGWGTGRWMKLCARKKMGWWWWLASLGQRSCRNLVRHGGGWRRRRPPPWQRRRWWARVRLLVALLPFQKFRWLS